MHKHMRHGCSWDVACCTVGSRSDLLSLSKRMCYNLHDVLCDWSGRGWDLGVLMNMMQVPCRCGLVLLFLLRFGVGPRPRTTRGWLGSRVARSSATRHPSPAWPSGYYIILHSVSLHALSVGWTVVAGRCNATIRRKGRARDLCAPARATHERPPRHHSIAVRR